MLFCCVCFFFVLHETIYMCALINYGLEKLIYAAVEMN